MITVLDPALERLIDLGAQAEKIVSGLQFTEGPVWHSREKHLVFSDIPASTIYRWSEEKGLAVLRTPSGKANGNTYDRRGRLITCEHEGRRVSRTLADGTVETLAGHYQGKTLNSPNDVICSSRGEIYFTDPPYGLRRPDGTFGEGEIGFNGVYRRSPQDESLTLLIDDFVRPNGLLLNAEETRLFINDTDLLHVRVFDIAADGTLQNGRVFAELKHGDREGRPDGMKLDVEGNLYVAGGVTGEVWVFNPEGKPLGFIKFDEGPANLAWGGDDWKTMYVTARTSVFRIDLKVSGMPVVI